MTFVTAAFTLAGFSFLFGLFAAWAGYKSGGLSRTILLVYAAAFLFLSCFSVLVGVGFAIELTNQAPCEFLVSNTTVNGNVTDYNYVDGCAGRSTPESVERLYQAYTYILFAVVLVSILSLMFIGLKAVVFKW